MEFRAHAFGLALGAALTACSSSSTNPSVASGGSSTGATGGSAGGSGGSITGGTGGSGGSVSVKPNCKNVPPTCGPAGNDDCCARTLIPSEPFPMGRSQSGSDAFALGDPDEQPEHNAQPQAIELDVYEVTLSRFQPFYDAFAGPPAAGAGMHPGIPSSGWDSAWDSELTVMSSILQCGNNSVWSDPQQAELFPLPMNCLTWHIAFAFCAWDGGFLPTEAEWEMAAAGGSANRLYPWGATAPDLTLANFGCKGEAATACEFADILVPGSKSGAGKYGQYDVAGSMWEWVLDTYAADWYTTGGATCVGCANLSGTGRVLRGGSWMTKADTLRAAARLNGVPSEQDIDRGVRCARTPGS